ncbi:unnamed protein product [Closterium sp. NIES-64]|nr:unnamed protein product [Closterium sp. NIES-64]
MFAGRLARCPLPFVAIPSPRRPPFPSSPSLPLVALPFPRRPPLPIVALPSPRRHRFNSFAPTYHTQQPEQTSLRSPTYLVLPPHITTLLPHISHAFPPTLPRSFPHILPTFPCPAVASPGIASLARQPPLSLPLIALAFPRLSFFRLPVSLAFFVALLSAPRRLRLPSRVPSPLAHLSPSLFSPYLLPSLAPTIARRLPPTYTAPSHWLPLSLFPPSSALLPTIPCPASPHLSCFPPSSELLPPIRCFPPSSELLPPIL